MGVDMVEENSRKHGERFYVGIDAGSVSLNCMVINQEKEIVFEAPYRRHFGRVEAAVLKILRELYGNMGQENIKAVAFTGNHGKLICEEMGGRYEFETICQVQGALHIKPDVKSIISMGGARHGPLPDTP